MLTYIYGNIPNVKLTITIKSISLFEINENKVSNCLKVIFSLEILAKKIIVIELF